MSAVARDRPWHIQLDLRTLLLRHYKVAQAKNRDLAILDKSFDPIHLKRFLSLVKSEFKKAKEYPEKEKGLSRQHVMFYDGDKFPDAVAVRAMYELVCPSTEPNRDKVLGATSTIMNEALRALGKKWLSMGLSLPKDESKGSLLANRDTVRWLVNQARDSGIETDDDNGEPFILGGATSFKDTIPLWLWSHFENIVRLGDAERRDAAAERRADRLAAAHRFTDVKRGLNALSSDDDSDWLPDSEESDGESDDGELDDDEVADSDAEMPDADDAAPSDPKRPTRLPQPRRDTRDRERKRSG
jgi:hypothetical protein